MFKLKRCPNCNRSGWVETIRGLWPTMYYQNICLTCMWKTKKTRFAWQADLAWNRGEMEAER